MISSEQEFKMIEQENSISKESYSDLFYEYLKLKYETLKIATDFIEEITNAAGKYDYVDKTPLVADAYSTLTKIIKELENKK